MPSKPLEIEIIEEIDQLDEEDGDDVTVIYEYEILEDGEDFEEL